MSAQVFKLWDGREMTGTEIREAFNRGELKGWLRSDGVVGFPSGHSLGIDNVLVGPGEAPTPGICCPPPGWCGTAARKGTPTSDTTPPGAPDEEASDEVKPAE